MASRLTPVDKAGKEKVLVDAADEAREALAEVTRPENVGEHAGVVLEADRVVTHAFECELPGYTGWFWTATLTRASRSKKVTVNEMSLIPGDDALLAPEWVPWSARLDPDDVSPTDRLPYVADDPRLVQNFEDTSDDADQLDEFELGLGRPRVLSEEGKKDAFDRWYNSSRGPGTAGTKAAKANCSSCGFMLLMAGSARTMFGVCANEWSPDDGKVVSMDHGCGAHSETDQPRQNKLWDQSAPVINEADLDIVRDDT